jgi:(p)ppGpp synthase/HD superfamily hydrolase
MVALAWLHDVVEDTTVTLREVERTFGASIADGVRCLTGSANSSISSEERSRRDRQRLAAGDTDVHSVKLAEIACRLSSLCRLNSEAELAGYLEEKRLEVGVLTQGDDGLKRLVRTLWSEAKRMAGSSKV